MTHHYYTIPLKLHRLYRVRFNTIPRYRVRVFPKSGLAVDSNRVNKNVANAWRKPGRISGSRFLKLIYCYAICCVAVSWKVGIVIYVTFYSRANTPDCETRSESSPFPLPFAFAVLFYAVLFSFRFVVVDLFHSGADTAFPAAYFVSCIFCRRHVTIHPVVFWRGFDQFYLSRLARIRRLYREKKPTDKFRDDKAWPSQHAHPPSFRTSVSPFLPLTKRENLARWISSARTAFIA